MIFVLSRFVLDWTIPKLGLMSPIFVFFLIKIFLVLSKKDTGNTTIILALE